MSVYVFAIDNVKAYIGSEENKKQLAQGGRSMNAFDAAQVLAVAFMKPQGEVLAELIRPNRTAGG
jgi:hypothetical protein